MTWRNNLRPAKLGKAAFHVDSADGQFGRNVQVHEYPLRDKPFVEDLGRKARRITLECYVLADLANKYNYMPERDALIAELESAGTKTLVHPYLGDLKVNVVEATGPRESTAQGGMARFTLTLVESGEREFPSGNADTQAISDKRARLALQEIITACSKRFSVLGTPDQNSTAAISQLQKWTTRLNTLVTRLTTIPAALTTFMADLSAFSGALSQLILVPQTLTSNALALFAQFGNIVAAPVAAAGIVRTLPGAGSTASVSGSVSITASAAAASPVVALDIVRDLFTFGDDLPVPPDFGAITRVQQQVNETALNDFIRQAALLTAVQISAQIDFGSADEALALRDELLEVFDVQAEAASSDAVYYALADARAAFVADMETRAAQLNRLITVTLPESTSALVLAFELYGDALREPEVVARNRSRDPLFLPSGVKLEVLSNG